MFFNDLAGQATYQDHPVHLEFIKNYGHLWEKVVVYDAMEVESFRAAKGAKKRVNIQVVPCDRFVQTTSYSFSTISLSALQILHGCIFTSSYSASASCNS